VQFDRVGVFTYSIEENTGAGVMDGQVPDHIKVERRDALMTLQQGISERKTQALVGRTMKVIVDGVSEEHEYVFEGRHYGQAPDIDGVVYLSYDDGAAPATPGAMVDVEITSATAYDLVGSVLPTSPLKLDSDTVHLRF
jgi:ribosomal protein S12 methylthiotransferase